MFDLAVTVPAVFGDRPLTDGIATAGDLGADGIEFFDWREHGIEPVATACDDAGVSLAATLSGGAGSNIEDVDAPSMTDPECRERAVNDIERSIDACESVGCPNLIVTVGPEQSDFEQSAQRTAIIEVLESVAPRAEEADVTLVVEPLNTRIDHPGYFLSTSEKAFDVVEDVGSSHVAVLFDVYHQQITEGDVTRRLTENLEHVGHVHIADNPGRDAPGTGELNYESILAALDDAGYEGYVGCEFIPAGDPEEALRRTLRLVDRANE